LVQNDYYRYSLNSQKKEYLTLIKPWTWGAKMGIVESKLSELKLSLPEAPKPVAAYIPAKQTGNLVFTAGQLPMVNGELI
jgi:hypothetical protein